MTSSGIEAQIADDLGSGSVDLADVHEGIVRAAFITIDAVCSTLAVTTHSGDFQHLFNVRLTMLKRLTEEKRITWEEPSQLAGLISASSNLVNMARALSMRTEGEHSACYIQEADGLAELGILLASHAHMIHDVLSMTEDNDNDEAN